MLNNTDVEESIKQVIREIASQHDLILTEVSMELDIVDDLGFSSLGVVALVAELEDALNVNPFEVEGVVMTDIRTVADLVKIYCHCFAVSKWSVYKNST